MKTVRLVAAIGLLGLAGSSIAADAVLEPYTQAARQADARFSGFTVSRGETLFRARQSGTQHESCTSCHTADPRQSGQHEKTGKVIEPLAPVANAKRLTEPAKVEKWFRRNCKEVLGRECSPVEKGDFVTYMRSVK